jgi:hypothetical protein
VLTCQADQFMSDSADILIFKQSKSLQRIVQLSDAFRQVSSAEQGSNIFIRVATDEKMYNKKLSYIVKHVIH